MDDAAKARFSKRTGVCECRVGSPDITASDMCYSAAEKLIADLGWKKNEVEAVVFASQSQDYLLPATACILQDRLGLPKTCLAFDISLGCSGYVYSLAIVASMVSAMKLRKTLLLVGESTLLHNIPENTHSYPLFGKAGTATALEYDALAPDMFFELFTDGAGYKSIIRKSGGTRYPVNTEALEVKDIGDGAKARDVDTFIDGAAIMEFTLREVPPCVKSILKRANVSIDDIDGFYFHQANKMINETVRKICRIPAEKAYYSIEKFANTSCASIPLTLTVCSAKKARSENLTNMFCAFGVGLSWGSAIINTDHIVAPELIEL